MADDDFLAPFLSPPSSRRCSSCGSAFLAMGPATRCNACDERTAIRTAISLAMGTIPPRYRGLSLARPETFRGRVKASEATRLVRALANVDLSVSLILTLSGGAGVGKTTLASAFFGAWLESEARTIQERESAQFVSARIVPSFRGQPAMTDLMKQRLLFIDDLGSEEPTPTGRNALATLISERHEWERPTIITTWLDVDGVRNAYGDGIARRLFERGDHFAW